MRLTITPETFNETSCGNVQQIFSAFSLCENLSQFNGYRFESFQGCLTVLQVVDKLFHAICHLRFGTPEYSLANMTRFSVLNYSACIVFTCTSDYRRGLD
jgi:hypothetical protein